MTNLFKQLLIVHTVLININIISTKILEHQVLSFACHTHPHRTSIGVVHGDLQRQHPFGTTSRTIGPVPADPRQ